jgi:hypothetical protein
MDQTELSKRAKREGRWGVGLSTSAPTGVSDCGAET